MVGLYLGFDVVSIITLLFLFNRTISETNERIEKDSQTQGDHSGSGDKERTIRGPNTHYAKQPGSPQHSRQEQPSSEIDVAELAPAHL